MTNSPTLSRLDADRDDLQTLNDATCGDQTDDPDRLQAGYVLMLARTAATLNMPEDNTAVFLTSAAGNDTRRLQHLCDASDGTELHPHARAALDHSLTEIDDDAFRQSRVLRLASEMLALAGEAQPGEPTRETLDHLDHLATGSHATDALCVASATATGYTRLVLAQVATRQRRRDIDRPGPDTRA